MFMLILFKVLSYVKFLLSLRYGIIFMIFFR